MKTTETMTTAMTTTATTEPAVGPLARVTGSARRAASMIRVRVVVGYVLLLAGALALVTIVVRQVLLTRLDREIEQTSAQEVEELRLLATGVDPATGEPFAGDARAILDVFLARNVPLRGEAFFTLVAGRPYAMSTGAPAALLDDRALVAQWATLREPQRETIQTTAGEARTLAVPLLASDGTTSGTFVVATFPAQISDEVTEAVRVIVIVGTVVLVLSSLVAWSLAGRVLQPVRSLTATSKRISDSDLTARFPVEGHDELAELGRTFNAMLDRLETGFASQRAFLDDVAHELRTPITIVRGHLELLGDDPADRADTVALCTDELDRMGRYVNDLLLVAKAQRPDFLKLQPVDIGELMDGLLARAQAIADRAWTLDAAPQPGRVWILADPDRLTQAIINLAQNAVQQTAAGATIGLGATVPGTELHLWVRDDGPGIEPTLRARLFQRFSRGTGSNATRPEGTGLGLAIVRAIAEAHGGRVDVDSELGRGARFTLIIPLDEGTTP
jgi:signal transduction histidine kinase